MAKASQLRSRGFESRCGFVGAAVHQYGHSQRRVEGWKFCVRPPSEESGGLEVSGHHYASWQGPLQPEWQRTPDYDRVNM